MCELVRVLYTLVRLKRFRAILIRMHLERCPRCGLAAPDLEGWGSLIRPPDWISREPSFWPAIQRRMRETVWGGSAPGPVEAERPFARLAAAAGGILAVAVLAVLLWLRPPGGHVSPSAPALEAPRIEVLSAEVQGRPTRASVYQTKTASFIWFYPTPRKEG